MFMTCTRKYFSSKITAMALAISGILIFSGCENDRLAPSPTSNLWEKILSHQELNKDEKNLLNAATVHMGMGKDYLAQGKLIQAADRFKKLLVVMPDNAEGMNALGKTYYQMGQRKAAEQMFNEALQRAEPLQKKLPIVKAAIADSYTLLGNIYRDWQRIPEAMAAYEKASILVPTNPLPAYELGHLYLVRGDWKNTLMIMDQVLEIDTFFNNAILDRAIAKFKLGDAVGAMQDINLLEAPPRNMRVSKEFKREVILELRRREAQQRPKMGL